MLGRLGATGCLSARERADGVHGEDAGVSGAERGGAGGYLD